MTAKEFNELYSIGQPVIYHPVIGEPDGFKTKTRSMAWSLRMVRGCKSVVMVEGKSGCVSLEAIEVVEVKGE